MFIIQVMENFENEIWVTTYCSPFYEVSNFGRVRSVERYVKIGKTSKRLITAKLKNLRKWDGYFRTDMMLETGEKKTKKVHQLVYHSFTNTIPVRGMNVDHIDGDITNNKLNNLQFITSGENTLKGKIVTNKKSGLPLYIYKNRSKFCVKKYVDNKFRHFGNFDSLEDAMKSKEELMKSNWKIEK